MVRHGLACVWQVLLLAPLVATYRCAAKLLAAVHANKRAAIDVVFMVSTYIFEEGRINEASAR